MKAVYTLSDPRSGLVRYVGYTKKPLSVRLEEHIYEARWPRTKHLRKSRWIAALGALGLVPEISALTEVVDGACWQEIERTAIAELRRGGADLCNLTAGGDGLTEPSKETRDRMAAKRRGTKLSAEAIEKRSAKQRGRKRSPEFCARLSEVSKGRKPTDATRLKNSIANKGKKLSPETCAKMSRSRTGLRHTDESKAKMSAAQLVISKSRRPKPPVTESTKVRLRQACSRRSPEHYRKAWQTRRKNDSAKQLVLGTSDGILWVDF